MPAIPQSVEGEPLVQVRDLRARLGGKSVFDGLTLEVPRGSITAIMGPSGTGKTTLLRHITGQLRADSGGVRVAGEDVARLSRNALFALRVIIIPILAHHHVSALGAVSAFCGLSIVYHLIIVSVGIWAAMRYDRALAPARSSPERFTPIPTGETYG